MTAAPRARFYLLDKRDDLRPWAMEEAARLWREGKSTWRIAVTLGVHESEIANRLDAIKKMAGAA